MTMILGVGIDIVEIERIRGVLSRYPLRFLKRVFTPFEQDYCLKRKNPALHFAGRFAAKEAVSKALGTGFKGFNWQDIEIRSDDKGKPYVYFSSVITELFECHPCMQISISHCHQYATAFAIRTD